MIEKKKLNRELVGELIDLCRMNDEEAFGLLMKNYSGMAGWVYKQLESTSLNWSEWRTVFQDKLQLAIIRYRDDQRVTFDTYLCNMLQNAARDFLRGRQYHEEQRTLSLDQANTETQLSILAMMADPDVPDAGTLNFQASLDRIDQQAKIMLSSSDYAVYHSLMDGKAVASICRDHDTTRSRVRALRRRIRDLCPEIDTLCWQ